MMINKKRTQFEKYCDIVEDIGALNEKYIKLFIDLHTHNTIVDADFYVAAQKALTEQYQAELSLLRAQSRHKNEEKFYLANSKTAALGIFSFRRWFKRHDSPMKQVLDERIAREAEGYLNDLTSGIEPPSEESEETSTPGTDGQSSEMETAPKKAEVLDSSERMESQEDFENEPFDLITIKREIAADNLKELCELEANFDESRELIPEKSADEEMLEPKTLFNRLELPEVSDSERSDESVGPDEEN